MLSATHRSSWQLQRRGGGAQQGFRRLRPAAELGGRAGSSSGGSGEGDPHRWLPGGRQGGRRKKARQPGLFEVEDMSPPSRSLGIHALPPNTHNGDQVEIAGSSYVVQSVVLQFKLVRGKYRRDHARLEVQGTGRWMANLYLENVFQLDAPPEGGGGSGSGSGSGGPAGSS
ncbi:hypothetical protein CHLNCDRAFT_51665 [Chlorella variabilis]|uniref:Uncharacterized protein n=1 Tax=Chlorella variabilis TaxID=554065 RepID=E1ZBK9_CHLVA|nr:hypothetical protein CHLNCDRAFT_51665 [Chlorella variabilis]EFN56875.1 hypothetical protein CHLNCDRAFT_51665 [Chlorella variabilis]|eukprot:XP_005848977.1 hypothetical protein CHLNCDRAFT_51665 [Chlorella variabilis]